MPAPAIRSARKPLRAFTILELSVALLLVALVGTSAIWAFFSRSEVTLDNATRLLVQDLRLAQNLAEVQRTPVEVSFFPDGSGYGIVAHATGAVPHQAERRHYSSDAVFEGVQIVAVDFGLRRGVLFDAHGAAVQAGRVTLSYRGEARTVLVEAGRGQILVPGSRVLD
jgi:hypothetical protein